MCPGNPAHSDRWVGRRSLPHLGKVGDRSESELRDTTDFWSSRPPIGSILTESKEDLVFFPLQVELVHSEQGLKLFPADVVQDLLGWRHKG